MVNLKNYNDVLKLFVIFLTFLSFISSDKQIYHNFKTKKNEIAITPKEKNISTKLESSYNKNSGKLIFILILKNQNLLIKNRWPF